MNSMTWNQMNELETLTYEARAMLEVTSDGLSNEPCPSNPEDSAAMIRMVVEKIDKVREIHEEMWRIQRESRADANDGDNEDADRDESFDTKDVFSDLCTAVDEHESQKEKEAEESTPRFDVEEIMRHEDGSATFRVSGSDEEMKKLFEVFFAHAVINGIKYTKEDNDKEVYRMQVVTAARELEVLLREWETSDDLDYDPIVKNKRFKLKELLDKAGA
jgi:hypothetical protein